MVIMMKVFYFFIINYLHLEEDIIYILENIEYAITREKAKALLEKFDYDAAAAIQYFLSNKSKIK